VEGVIMSDSTATTTRNPETVVHKHPIRGLLWGLMFGIGLTVVLVLTTVISLELTTMVIVTVVGTVIGVLWGMFGPAKAPKGPAPAPYHWPEPPQAPPPGESATPEPVTDETAQAARIVETSAAPEGSPDDD
jgi:hypothetical protein